MPKKRNIEGLDLTVYTKDGKLRRRKQKTNRNYFTQDTEDAIIRYISTESHVERDKIFTEHINESIYKLAQCITNTFKFTYAQQETIRLTDIEHEVVVKLLSEFHNYKQSLGKAYSYFGTVAKRYLIQYNDKEYKKQKLRKNLEDVDSDRKITNALQEEENNDSISDFVKQYVTYMERTIDSPHNYSVKDKEGYITETVIELTDKDKDIVRCILGFFKNVQELEIFDKPAFYLEIRERTGQRTLDITRVIKIMKHVMKEQRVIYYLEGELDI